MHAVLSGCLYNPELLLGLPDTTHLSQQDYVIMQIYGVCMCLKVMHIYIYLVFELWIE